MHLCTGLKPGENETDSPKLIQWEEKPAALRLTIGLSDGGANGAARCNGRTDN